MGCRLHVSHFQGLNVGGMFQDGTELLRELVDLVVGQFKARQTRYMDHLVTGNALSHGPQG